MIEMNLNNSPAHVAEKKSSGKPKKNARLLILVIILAIILFITTFLIKDDTTQGNAISAVKSLGDIVEIVVDSISGKSHEIPVEIKEDDTTKFEQLDYKSIVLDDLLKNVSIEISFDTIIVLNYKSFVAKGSSRNKDAIGALLSKLDENNWELLPKPKTNIRENNGIYYFQIEAIGKKL